MAQRSLQSRLPGRHEAAVTGNSSLRDPHERLPKSHALRFRSRTCLRAKATLGPVGSGHRTAVI